MLFQVYVTGKIGDPELKVLLSVIRNRYMPDVLAHAEETSYSELARSLAAKEKGKVAAHVCKNNSCNLPVYTADKLTVLLDRTATTQQLCKYLISLLMVNFNLKKCIY